MTTIGWATLDVVPVLKGGASAISAQTRAPMATAGRDAGTRYGAAAGQSAGSAFAGRFQSGLRSAAAPLAGLFAVAGVTRWAGATFDALKRIETINAQTASAIRATGGAANVSADGVEALAGQLETLTASEAESTQEGANLLLTFRNIKNEAGEGNDVFDQTVRAMVDMSRAMGTDAAGSAIQLGKALNDPLKGVSALQRVGVSFTEQQKAQIQGYVDQNRLLDAQKLILAELNTQFGGSGEAFAATDAGKIELANHKFGELSEELLGRTLPAAASVAEAFRNDVVPVLEGAGSVAGDAVAGFKSLPAPVQQVAAAFVALRVASATGLTGIIGSRTQSGIRSTSSALDTLRLRTMFAADAYRTSRGASNDWALGNGRLVASLDAVKAGADGAGRTAGRAFSGLSGLVGGPFGAAFLAGTVIVGRFVQAQREARARVEDHTAALDQQTGALTANNAEVAFKALQDAKAIDAARELGLSLDVLRGAALGDADATSKLNKQLDEMAQALEGTTAESQTDKQRMLAIAIDRVRDAVGGSNAELQEALGAWRAQAEFMGQTEDATDGAAKATRTYADRIEEARDAVRKLRREEAERRADLLQDRRDAVALQEVLAAARQEARRGRGGFDLESGEGRRNLSALLDIADQFNNSTQKVRDQNFEATRSEFVRLAEKMGKSEREADKLVRQLLNVPRSVKLRYQSEGFRERMAEMRELQRMMNAVDPNDPLGAGAGRPSNPPPLRDPLNDTQRGPGTTNYYGPVTYTDEEQGRRRASQRGRRAGTDGVRRP